MDYIKIAGKHRRSCQFEKAGKYYSLASFESLGRSEFEQESVGGALFHQVYAAICYKLANNSARCINRCEQAILILTDLRDNEFDEPAWIGLTHELEGDLRIIGNLGDEYDVYDRARDCYENVEAASSSAEMMGWCTEHGFDLSFVLLDRLMKSVGRSFNEPSRATLGSHSLVKRIDFKRENFESLINELIELSDWRWEGGEE